MSHNKYKPILKRSLTKIFQYFFTVSLLRTAALVTDTESRQRPQPGLRVADG